MSNLDYRKMFEGLDEYEPEPDDLRKLAAAMSNKAEFPDASSDFTFLHEVVKATPQEIPAGYTYFAQFLAHDISFDSRSDRFLEEDRPWNEIDVAAVKNKRQPFFDLETIYGHKNPVNEWEIFRDDLMQKSALPFLKLGDTEAVPGFPAFPNDLPRKDGSTEANIVDPRNDENLLVAQTQVAFVKFHNAMVLELNDSGKYKNKDDLFEQARRLTVRYYQHIILEDFLLRFIEESFRDEIVAKVKSGDSSLFYNATAGEMFVPLEFTVAAFRMGHSMIRAGYDLNKLHNAQTQSVATLDKLMLFTGRGKMMPSPLFSPLKLPSTWIIDWHLFYDIDDSKPNAAEIIDTELPLALLRLRPRAPGNASGAASSIAAFDLFRGRAFKLPAGQDVARAIEAKPISAEDMGSLLRSKKIETSESEREDILRRLQAAFCEKTPLWFYILAEAEIQNDGKLGAVGSRIVAETIIKILYLSEFSILREEWKPDEDFLLKTYQTFGMAEMLKFVRDTNRKYFETIYPDRTIYFDELNPLGNKIN